MAESLPDDLLAWLIAAGYPATSQVTPLKRGLGANEIWKLERGPDDPPLIVRVFGAGDDANASRERAAMSAACSGGIPAPGVLAAGHVADRPVLVTSFMPGQLAVEVILGNPDSVAALGTAIGDTFGRLHLIPAPPDLGRATGAWIDLAGDAIAPLRSILAALPIQDRLIHLDYHPRNVLVDNGLVTGVIDWENVHAGPPHADVGRTLAILRMMELADLVPPAAGTVVNTFGTALAAAHDRIAGPSPAPAVLMAWGLAMTAVDLGRQAGKLGNPFSSTVLARLQTERDAAIATALEGV